MTKKDKVVNVKMDSETKSKLETLAYLNEMSIQNLCLKLITDELDANADVIASAQELKAKFQK